MEEKGRCCAAPGLGSGCVKKFCASTRTTSSRWFHPRAQRAAEEKEEGKMSLLMRSTIDWLGRRESHRLDHAAIAPAIAQHRFLLKILTKNARTSFGIQHGFASIRTETDYRRRVPIRDYEEFRPYVARMMKGDLAVLTAERPA